MKKRYSTTAINLIKRREVETWIYSYADLVSNLLMLFVMLFILSNSSSKTQSDFIRGLEVFVKDKNYATGRKGNGASDVDQFQQMIAKVLQHSELSGQVNLNRQPTGLELSFESAMVFDTGTATLIPESLQILEELAPLFTALPPEFYIIVEGHADSRPVNSGNYPSNWELSSARAGAVVRALESKGVPGNRMRAIGYSNTRPLDSDNLDAVENRRVVIKIDKDTEVQAN